MNYSIIFKEALNTFWRHKSLWIFGIVITIFGQGEYGFSVNYRESYPAGQGGLPDMPGRDLLINFFENLDIGDIFSDFINLHLGLFFFLPMPITQNQAARHKTNK